MYILSFDQGTTSTMAMIFDAAGQMVSSARLPHKQIYEKPGWVSHQPQEILDNIIKTGKKAMEIGKIKPIDIQCVGLTNQRETVVAWDKITGQPIENAIVWQCKRSVGIVNRMIEDGLESVIHEKTGLIMDAYFSASKMIWLLENSKEVREALAENRLYMGNIDSYLLHQLTGAFVTDHSNASRTMVYNIHTNQWDLELLRYFNIPEEVLPTIIPSGIDLANAPIIHPRFFGNPLPVTGVLGDQQAALFGQMCFESGDTKSTYGTGCFILQNVGSSPIITKGPIVSTVAWAIGSDILFALEASLFSAGSAIQWLFDIGLIDSFEMLDSILASTPSTKGVYFVPAFNGLGAPHWNKGARASFQGITLGTKKAHLVKAVSDSIVYQVLDALNYMEQESGIALQSLMVDGGVSVNKHLMQLQSDLLGLPVKRAAIGETTCLGVAYLAGLQSGFYKDYEQLQTFKNLKEAFNPQGSLSKKDWQAWQLAVEKTIDWSE